MSTLAPSNNNPAPMDNDAAPRNNPQHPPMRTATHKQNDHTVPPSDNAQGQRRAPTHGRLRGLSSAPPIPAGIRSFQWNSGGCRWNEILQKALLISLFRNLQRNVPQNGVPRNLLELFICLLFICDQQQAMFGCDCSSHHHHQHTQQPTTTAHTTNATTPTTTTDSNKQRPHMNKNGHKRPQPPQPPQPPPSSKTTPHHLVTTVASSCQCPPPSATTHNHHPLRRQRVASHVTSQVSTRPVTWHVNGHATSFDCDDADCPRNDRPRKRPSRPQTTLPANDDHNQPQLPPKDAQRLWNDTGDNHNDQRAPFTIPHEPQCARTTTSQNGNLGSWAMRTRVTTRTWVTTKTRSHYSPLPSLKY